MSQRSNLQEKNYYELFENKNKIKISAVKQKQYSDKNLQQ